MTAETLLDLAARCEAATGHDYALDAAITVALQIGCRKNLPDDLEYLTAVRPDDGEHEGSVWFHCRSGKSLHASLKYTASLDAAMSLVPEGWYPKLWKEAPDYWCAHLGFMNKAVGQNGKAATAVLALCAAALRARAAQS